MHLLADLKIIIWNNFLFFIEKILLTWIKNTTKIDDTRHMFFFFFSFYKIKKHKTIWKTYLVIVLQHYYIYVVWTSIKIGVLD